MRAEEWIAILSEEAKKNEYRFETIRECVPLGAYADGTVAVAHREEKPDRYHYTLVSGAGKREFILRLVSTLACIYDTNEAEFLVLSPYGEYAELLGLENADITVLYLRCEEDFDEAMRTVRELVAMRSLKAGYPKLFVVAEGLEKIEGLQKDDVTDPYTRCLNTVGTSGSEVIAGVNVSESAFGGYPGAVIGIGNCLVSVKGNGKADLTHVGADSSLGVPREITYPSAPTVKEAVEFFNGVAKS